MEKCVIWTLRDDGHDRNGNPRRFVSAVVIEGKCKPLVEAYNIDVGYVGNRRAVENAIAEQLGMEKEHSPSGWRK